ncbi:MAG TPA: LytTR family DNA-binding domain-containing protein [Saprospiraceae bacterium]|nr:LytTR family DNA-binding domain-containing protein [Saprospiraceae bacterium]
MLRALIVEDEHLNREVLKSLIKTYCEGITIVGEAQDVKTAIDAIKSMRPEVVFMDIELGDGTAFDVLREIGKPEFQLVFTSAYDHYAVRAFKFNALDYLLKPIDPDELKAAVQKVRKAGTPQHRNLEHFLTNISNTRNENPVITLSTSESFEYIPVRNIVRCEAQGAYTKFYMKNKSSLLVSKTLKEYEPLLQPYHFFRTHQSHLINLHEVERYLKGDGGYVVLKDGMKIGVARTRRDEFLRAMRSLREI